MPPLVSLLQAALRECAQTEWHKWQRREARGRARQSHAREVCEI